MLITLDDALPLHRQIYEKLRDQVLSGELKAGQKLPATREMAQNLSVSRTTVLQAYDQLIAEGYIHTRRGSGTYISALPQPREMVGTKPGIMEKGQPFPLSDSVRQMNSYVDSLFNAPTPPNNVPVRYDFRMGAVRMDNRSGHVWRSLVNRCLKEKESPFLDPQGYYPLRQAIAEHLQRVRNCHCRAENIVITQGAQQAFDLLGRLFLNPGDTVALEEPGFFGARQAFKACRAKCVYVDIDREGISIEQLNRKAAKAKLVYVTPSHQFPTGCIMSLSRRMALVEWARSNNACIIEDDYDSEFHYGGRPMEAIQSIDPHGSTVYVGTFSKVLSPALRMGYAVLPEPLVAPFVTLRWTAGMASAPLQQQALARWMTEGYHHRHLRRMHKCYAERYSVLLYCLEKYFADDDVRIEASNTGLHVLLWLNRLTADRGMACLEKLRERAIAVFSAQGFYHRPPAQWGAGLGFGLIDAEDIEPGIRLLQETVVGFC